MLCALIVTGLGHLSDWKIKAANRDRKRKTRMVVSNTSIFTIQATIGRKYKDTATKLDKPKTTR
jgi:hypothetical protein